MSTVYRARDLATAEIVAVKVIDTPQSWDRIHREISALRSITHPNIVEILDAGYEEEQAVLVMEYASGSTLRQWLHERSPSWCEALQITIALLDGLVPIHDAGLVHRDIKPTNLVIESVQPVKLKIIDFGIVKPMDEDQRITEVGMILGTPTYMPPEQLIGLSIDASADIYAVGLLLWQMLTGVEPTKLALQRVGGKMRFAARLERDCDRGMPDEVWQVMREMLHPLSHRRLRCARQGAEQLRSALTRGDGVPQRRRSQPTTTRYAVASPAKG